MAALNLNALEGMPQVAIAVAIAITIAKEMAIAKAKAIAITITICSTSASDARAMTTRSAKLLCLFANPETRHSMIFVV